MVARERVLAGNTLALLGDPRPEITSVDAMQFCWVPAGNFLMGDDASETRLDYGYWLAQYPVTVAQFQAYVSEAGIESGEPECLAKPVNHPVVQVSWSEAMAFCRWLAERWQTKGWLPAGWSVSLPSEAEWEKAARGGLKIPAAPLIRTLPLAPVDCPSRLNDQPSRVYPWGNEADPERMNAFETEIWRTSTVGCFPGGASPYGAEELSGNVWEWTRSDEKDYPYDPADGREDFKVQNFRVLRGGAFDCDARSARCAFRNVAVPVNRYVIIGFRVVVSPFFSER